MRGFFKILRQEQLTGQVPEWCEGIDPEAHIRWCFDPATIGIVLTVASTGLQAVSTLQAGKAEQQAGRDRQAALEHQAAQARQNAGQERAAAQRGAIEQRRQGRFLSSRALARSAASGAGAGDPTVENILGDIGAEGEFRALTELFVGEERARSLEHQADIKVFEGDQERRAGDIARGASRFGALTTVLSGGAKAAGIYAKMPDTTASTGTGLSRYGTPYTPQLKMQFRGLR